jgi:hypothetical protein
VGVDRDQVVGLHGGFLESRPIKVLLVNYI